MRKILILLVLVSLVIQSIEDDINNNIDYVYSPLYLNKLESSDQQWTPLTIKVATDSNIVFIASGFKGITVVNELGDQILFQQNLSDNYISSFAVTKSGKYLFVGVRTSLIIYKLTFNTDGQNQFTLQEFAQIQTLQLPSDILRIVYSEEKELLIVAAKEGHVIAFDSQNKQNLYQVGTFNTGSTLINNIFLSKDTNWIYVSSDIKGLIMVKLEEITSNSSQNNNNLQRQFNLIMAGYGTLGLRAYDAVATSDNLFIYGFDFWYGFFYANCQQVIESSKDQYPLFIPFQEYWPFLQFNPTCQTLKLNKEENYLFLGVRSQGIFVLDIRNRSKITLFQQIKADSLSYSIEFSKNEDYIYFSNAVSILTFYKNSSNLNDNFPNLFNVHQAKFQELKDVRYKWRCYTDAEDNYLIGSFDYSGLYVFPIHKDPYRLDTAVYKSYPDIQVDSIIFDESGKYMIIPQYYSPNLFGIYQYQPLNNNPDEQQISLLNIKEIKQFSINETQITEQISFSWDKKYAVQTYAVGLVLYDSSDIFNMKVLSRWFNPEFMLGENQGVCITKDNKWILSTIRLFGVYLLNAQDKTQLVLSDYLITLGGESIQISEVYDNYAYLIDGMKGFVIIDLSHLPKLKILSRVQLPGYCVMGQLLQNEQYILITQMEKGMLTLLDIRDKKFPLIINSFNYGKQFGTTVCLPKSKQHIFLTTSTGIIVLPIQSNVKIHSNVSRVIVNQETGINKIIKFEKNSINGGDSSLSISQEYIFQIGELIQFNFTILYPQDEDMHISTVYKYDNGQYVNIPFYFSFDLYQQSLLINVQKELLDSERVNPNLNIVLLKTVIPLNIKSFIYTSQDSTDKAETNSVQSNLILEYLIDKNILDSRRIISDNYDFTKKLKLDQQLQQQLIDPSTMPQDDYNTIMTQITQKISLTLMKSCYINPLKFFVYPSLSLNHNNSQQFIKTNSQEIMSITFQINKEDGKLVMQNNQGIISYISEQQDQLKIQGTSENINRALQQKVILANNTEITKDKSPNITITVDDKINYPLVQTFCTFECSIITFKKQLKVNTPLQKQINKQFADGIVDIETEISISFQLDSFIVEDIKEYTYKLYYSPNGSQDSYKEIQPDMWLQELSDNRLSFKGTTKSSMYRDVYYFKVVASDGYTKAEDYFSLKLYGIPFTYIFNLLFKILGPVVAVLGFYQKRSIFLNIIFSKSVSFSEEIAICGCNYHKQIIIVGKIAQDSKNIIYQLFTKIITKQSPKQLNQSPMGKSNIVNNLDQVSDIELQYQNMFLNPGEQFKKFEEAKLYIPNLKSVKKSISKTVQQVKKLKNHYPTSILEKRYLKEDGSLYMSQVIEDLQSFEIKLKSQFKQSHDYTQDIKDVNSRIYRVIRAQISRYFLSLDKRSYEIYNYIKYHSYQFINKSSSDWYKSVVSIQYNKNQQNSQSASIFPNLELKYEVLYFIFQTLKLFSDHSKKTPKNFTQLIELIKTNQANINLYLIREVIFADVLGFTQYIPSSYQPVIGESIHLNSYEIKQIIAFKKKNLKKWIRPLYQLLNIEYSKYGVSKNMRLPSWLNLDQKHGLIILDGTPQQEDLEEVLIRVYDLTGYVIQQFILKVVPNKNKLGRNASTINMDQIYTVPDEQDYSNDNQPNFFQNNQIAEKPFSQLNSSQCMNGEELFTKLPMTRQASSTCIIQNKKPILSLSPQYEKRILNKSKNQKKRTLQTYEFRKNRNSKNISQNNLDESSQQNNSKFQNSQIQFFKDSPLHLDFNFADKTDFLSETKQFNTTEHFEKDQNYYLEINDQIIQKK